MKFYTKNLTSGTFTIDSSNRVLQLSFKTSTDGSCTFIGDGKYGVNASETLSFGASDGITLMSENPQSPLEGITIAWASGSVRIIIGVT